MNRNGPAILAMRGRGLISRLIQWQTRGEVSHIAILLPDGETVIEAWQGKGVHKKKITDWTGVRVFDIPSATPEQWAGAIAFMESQIGKSYDYLGVLRFITRRDRDNPDKWFCSEAGFKAFLEQKLALLARIEPYEVSPAAFITSPLLVERL